MIVNEEIKEMINKRNVKGTLFDSEYMYETSFMTLKVNEVAVSQDFFKFYLGKKDNNIVVFVDEKNAYQEISNGKSILKHKINNTFTGGFLVNVEERGNSFHLHRDLVGGNFSTIIDKYIMERINNGEYIQVKNFWGNSLFLTFQRENDKYKLINKDVEYLFVIYTHKITSISEKAIIKVIETTGEIQYAYNYSDFRADSISALIMVGKIGSTIKIQLSQARFREKLPATEKEYTIYKYGIKENVNIKGEII